MTREQRTSDKNFFDRQKKNWHSLSSTYILSRANHFIPQLGNTLLLETAREGRLWNRFLSCFLCVLFLIFLNRVRIKAPLLTMTFPKNLIWQRFYARSEWKIYLQCEHVIFKAIFFDRTRTSFLSRSTRETDDKASVNKDESIKLLEPKIRLAFRNSLPIKNGT